MSCTACRLHATATSVCVAGRFGSANLRSIDILIVGEAPGPEEDKAGTAFIGPSGKELDSWLAAASVSDRVWITNSVRCIPRDTADGKFRKPTGQEIDTCSNLHLWPEIQALRPRVLVPVGAAATAAVLGGDPKMGAVRGKVFEVVRQFPGDSAPTTMQVVPTWHPSYILRGNKSARDEAIADLQLAAATASTEAPKQKRLDGHYRILRRVDEVDAWLDEVVRAADAAPGEYMELVYDSETTHADGWGSVPDPFDIRAKIVSMQFCYREGDAVFLPGEHPGSPFPEGLGANVLARVWRVLSQHARIGFVGQNIGYDVLFAYRRFGYWPARIAGDTMLANHALHGGSEENTLEALERQWLGVAGHKQMIEQEMAKLPPEQRRLESIDLEVIASYGCMDADATLRIHGLQCAALAQRGLLDMYRRWCVGPIPIVLDIQNNGMAVDVARLADVRPRLLAEMTAAEDEVNSLSIVRDVWSEANKQTNPKRLRYNRKTKTYDTVEAEPPFIYPQINLASPKQVASLLFDVLRLPAPREIIEGSRDERSTDKHYLAAVAGWVASNAPDSDAAKVIAALTRWRKVGHEWKTYIKPGALDSFIFDDGVTELPHTYARWASSVRDPVPCVHPTYSMDGTVTGRLSAKDPPAHGIAEKSLTAQLLCSRFGTLGLFLATDQSQMEVRTLVSLAKDERLSAAYAQGFDVHRYVASLTWKIPMAEVTDQQRARAKTVIFGIIYGRTEYGLVADPALKLTLQEAIALIESILSEFPRLREYIQAQHAFAWQHGYCVSPIGRYRPLPALVEYAGKYDAGNKRSPGYFEVKHDLNCAVNTPIQGVASEITLHGIGLARERLRAQGLLTANVGFTHDSLFNDVLVTEVKAVLPLVRAALATDNQTYFPWLTVPLVVEHKIGVTRGEQCVVQDAGDEWTIDGPPASALKVFNVLARAWDVECVSWEETKKKGKDVVHTVWRLGGLR